MYILIVTGLSGAGKSQVLGILEDMGFVCADNMPCQLAKQYIELCSSSENNIERVALVRLLSTAANRCSATIRSTLMMNCAGLNVRTK